MRSTLGSLCALFVGAGLLVGACGGDSKTGGTSAAGRSSAGAGTGGNTNGGSAGQGGRSGAGGSSAGAGGSAGAATGGDGVGGSDTGGSGNGGAGAQSAGTGGKGMGGTSAGRGGTGGMDNGGAGGGNGGEDDGGAGANAGSSGAAGCAMDCSTAGLSCCGSLCTNTNNDVKNCGGCGEECPGTFPFCDNGTCGTAPCTSSSCGAGSCCDTECCSAGQLCCVVPGGPTGPPRCVEPVNDSCPPGCPNCPCASPDTPIATPSGERPISELRPGDLVYSVDGSATVAVPIKSVNVNPVVGHYVLRIVLANAAVLEISAMHPTADGRTLAALGPGAELDHVKILSVEQVAYAHAHTYDILPDSDTGAYYAGGVLMGSTLLRAPPPVTVP
jgi:hypothetical protein